MSIESALDRIEAAESAEGRRDDDREAQYEAYERTFRALAEVTPDDDDEGVTVVSRWIVDRMEETGERPSSRAVRKRAREYCEHNGYEVGDDEWLGS
jgi:hypothetical protein